MISWKKLNIEELECGDFWANQDPNMIAMQGQNGYNIQLQAVHQNSYGRRACDMVIGSGAYWRPILNYDYREMIGIKK